MIFGSDQGDISSHGLSQVFIKLVDMQAALSLVQLYSAQGMLPVSPCAQCISPPPDFCPQPFKGLQPLGVPPPGWHAPIPTHSPGGVSGDLVVDSVLSEPSHLPLEPDQEPSSFDVPVVCANMSEHVNNECDGVTVSEDDDFDQIASCDAACLRKSSRPPKKKRDKAKHLLQDTLCSAEPSTNFDDLAVCGGDDSDEAEFLSLLGSLPKSSLVVTLESSSICLTSGGGRGLSFAQSPTPKGSHRVFPRQLEIGCSIGSDSSIPMLGKIFTMPQGGENLLETTPPALVSECLPPQQDGSLGVLRVKGVDSSTFGIGTLIDGASSSDLSVSCDDKGVVAAVSDPSLVPIVSTITINSLNDATLTPCVNEVGASSTDLSLEAQSSLLASISSVVGKMRLPMTFTEPASSSASTFVIDPALRETILNAMKQCEATGLPRESLMQLLANLHPSFAEIVSRLSS